MLSRRVVRAISCDTSRRTRVSNFASSAIWIRLIRRLRLNGVDLSQSHRTLMTDKPSQTPELLKSASQPKRRKPSSRSRVFYLDMYALDLARGGAHIASALTPETRLSAIVEVVTGFRRKYGDEDLGVFLSMLDARLEARMAYEAAELLRGYIAELAVSMSSRTA